MDQLRLRLSLLLLRMMGHAVSFLAQVLDYENVQRVLLPAIASAYSLHFMGQSLMALYEQAERDKANNVSERGPLASPVDNAAGDLICCTAHAGMAAAGLGGLCCFMRTASCLLPMQDFSKLPELHALSSGLKALCTDITAGKIEECRRTCGGEALLLLLRRRRRPPLWPSGNPPPLAMSMGD